MTNNENWQILTRFVYPHEAQIAKSYLESEGIDSEIRDELTAQVHNFYSQAIGGVKLLVKEADIDKGMEALKKSGYLNDASQNEKIETIFIEKGHNLKNCPYCNSENISIKKVPGIWSLLGIFIFAVPFPILKKSLKCYDCYKEWKYRKKGATLRGRPQNINDDTEKI